MTNKPNNKVEIPCGQSIVWVFGDQTIEFAAKPQATLDIDELLPPPTPVLFERLGSPELQIVALTRVSDPLAIDDILDRLTDEGEGIETIPEIEILYTAEEP